MKEQSLILLVFCVVTGCLSKPATPVLEYKDSLGQYSFGYSAGNSARSELRTLDGATRGSYSYVDDAGTIQTAQYTADGVNGFQIVATNLPRAPKPISDTPEVVAARVDHLKAHELAHQSIDAISNEKIETKMAIDEKTNVGIENSENSIGTAIDSEIREKSGNLEARASKENLESSAETRDGISGNENESFVDAKKAELPMPIVEKIEGIEPVQPVESQSRSAIRSDVPVVTTSFVIPGTVDLHTRIELDHSGASEVRSSLEPSSLPISKPSSKLQGSEIDPSTITPASTKLTTKTSDEGKDVVSMESLPVTISPVQSTFTDYIAQPFSVPFLPGVIAPSNIVAVPYSIGSSHIYSHYNPYRYLSYGFL